MNFLVSNADVRHGLLEAWDFLEQWKDKAILYDRDCTMNFQLWLIRALESGFRRHKVQIKEIDVEAKIKS